jgi:hypothetical protein
MTNVLRLPEMTQADIDAMNKRNRAHRVTLGSAISSERGKSTGRPRGALDTKKRKPRADKLPPPPEKDVLSACLEFLAIHPKVAWAERQNVGGMEKDGRFIKFGFAGMADITGQMKDGRRLEIETKKRGKKPTPEQNAFLYLVNKNHGLALWVDSVDRLAFLLDKAA